MSSPTAEERAREVFADIIGSRAKKAEWVDESRRIIAAAIRSRAKKD